MAEKVTVELRDEINLRKLARAIIALAQQSLDEDQKPEEDLLEKAS